MLISRLEVIPARRQDAIATKYLIQYTLSAAACGATVPIIDSIGPGLLSVISVAFVYLAGGLCVITVLYGADMHRWAHRSSIAGEKT